MKPAYVLEQEDLNKIIEKVVEKVAQETKKWQLVEKPLTRNEAAAYFKISPITFDRRLKNGTLPSSLRRYNGGTIYFFASELEAFLKKPK